MKIKTPNSPILFSALLGLMMAGATHAATLRFQGSGDYTNVAAITGFGWYDPSVAGSPTTLPGSSDTVRFNYGGNTVWVTSIVPDVKQFQAGVDESGFLVISNGGKLTAVGTSANAIGYNKAPVLGTLTIYAGGEVVSSSPLEVGRQGIGIVTVDGGTLTLKHHLWVGSSATGVGTIIVTNGGVVNFLGTGGNGMLGLGTVDAVNASGGSGVIKVQSGGRLNLFNISGTSERSIQGANSYLDISGSGVVTIPGNRAATMTNYVNAGKIKACSGTGTVLIDYNNTNPGFTTLTAIDCYSPPTDLTWDPAGNPATTGLWSENANWAPDHFKPVAETKVSFNKPGAMTCVLNGPGAASYLVMGQSGPGGSLIVTNGGSLGCDAGDSTYIGYDNPAQVVIASGGSASFGTNVYVGLQSGGVGDLRLNGGSATIAGTLYVGTAGGLGTVHVENGRLNLANWDEFDAFGYGSSLDISGTGVVVINGDHVNSVNYYVTTGGITANGGNVVNVDYDKINTGKTTIYAPGVVLPPERVVWTAVAGSDGLWSTANNWNIQMVPGDVTTVTFNVLDTVPCVVSGAAVAGYFSMGDSSGPGGTLIITNGGSFTSTQIHWCGVGYSSTALMVVESGASASFAEHLWVGFSTGAEGTVVVNGGTVNVAGMFGLGWNGGKGIVQLNGGTLNLSQWHPTDSIKGASVLNITGTGAVVITGNYATSIANFVAAGKITANGGSNVAWGYDPSANKTIVQAAPARQSITNVEVNGANTILTYQSTSGHYYRIESSPTLPGTWTTVAGSSAKATGASASFSFPSGASPMFYRTVSP